MAALLTIAEALALYHLHPESKFHDADYLDRGVTRRRHVLVTGIRHIGKQANRLEEQQILGIDDDAQPDYGLLPDDIETRVMILRAKAKAKAFGIAELARRAGISTKVVRRILKAPTLAQLPLIERLSRASAMLEGKANERSAHHAEVVAWALAQRAELGITAFSRQVGVDVKNLVKMLIGKRALSAAVLARLVAIQANP